MTKSVSYSEARANLAKIWDQVIDDRDIILLTRRGQEDIALLPADELSSLLESVHILKSPKNAKRLLQALDRAKNKRQEAVTIDQLKNKLFQ